MLIKLVRCTVGGQEEAEVEAQVIVFHDLVQVITISLKQNLTQMVINEAKNIYL